MTGLRRTAALLTRADRVVLYALVGGGVVLLTATWRGGAGGHARISWPGGTGVVRLDEDARYDVEGPLGVTVVVVAGGSVSVMSSPCREHVCERMGPVRNRGGTVVCVPNRVIVTVQGAGGDRIDATTR